MLRTNFGDEENENDTALLRLNAKEGGGHKKNRLEQGCCILPKKLNHFGCVIQSK